MSYPSKFRASGRRGGAWSRTHKNVNLRKPLTDYPPGNGALLKKLGREDLPVDTVSGEMKISNCQLIASYNWLNKASAKIQVPGAPPCWTPLSEPVTLKEDDGEYLRDINAARSPAFPMEAAILASLQVQPDLNLEAIDLCACSSTLGSLLRFARDVKKPFRFWVELVGRTAFFVRREHSPKELIEDVYGYGHTFPDMYTTWPPDARDSESHQRVLNYNLAGKSLLVRFEGDGYLESLADNGRAKQFTGPQGQNEKPLEEALSGLLQKHSYSPGDKLTIQPGGRMIPQKAIFDLKTRSIKKKDQDVLLEEMPRLWISQIPNFILAFHKWGKFEDIEVKDVASTVKAWEHENQSDLKRFVYLIDMIMEMVSKTSLKKLEVRGTVEGILELREISDDQWSALSDNLHIRWLQVEPREEATDAKRSSLVESSAWSDDDDDNKDYTACSVDCGYCGRCLY